MDNQNPYGGGQPPAYPGSGYPGGGGGYPGGGGGTPMGTTGTLDIGDVLSTTFRTMFGAFVPIAGCALAVVLPQVAIGFVVQVLVYFALQALGGGSTPSEEELMAGVALGVVVYVVMILGILAVASVGQGGIMYAVVEHLSGRAPSLGTTLRVALSRALWVFLTFVLVLLAVSVGFAACIVPGIVIALFFCVAAPACIVEKLGPIDSISRSIALTEGQRLMIFLIYLVVGIGWFVVAMCIVVPVQMIVVGSAAVAGGAGGLADPLSFGQIIGQLVNIPVSLTATMLFSTLAAVIYARLRGLRDGVDAQALASVFS